MKIRIPLPCPWFWCPSGDTGSTISRQTAAPGLTRTSALPDRQYRYWCSGTCYCAGKSLMYLCNVVFFFFNLFGSLKHILESISWPLSGKEITQPDQEWYKKLHVIVNIIIMGVKTRITDILSWNKPVFILMKILIILLIFWVLRSVLPILLRRRYSSPSGHVFKNGFIPDSFEHVVWVTSPICKFLFSSKTSNFW